MKNKVMVIVLAITAGAIWTFIALRLLSDRNVKKEVPDVVPVIKLPEDIPLESISSSPFLLPEVVQIPESKHSSPANLRKAEGKKSKGRLVGVIEAAASMSVVVELNGKYRYLHENITDGECRLLEMFKNDSVRIVYSGDTLMLYKNERRH